MSSGDVLAAGTHACNNGQFSALIKLSDGDGAKTITVTQKDQVGNEGSASRTFMRGIMLVDGAEL